MLQLLIRRRRGGSISIRLRLCVLLTLLRIRSRLIGVGSGSTILICIRLSVVLFLLCRKGSRIRVSGELGRHLPRISAQIHHAIVVTFQLNSVPVDRRGRRQMIDHRNLSGLIPMQHNRWSQFGTSGSCWVTMREIR